MLISEIFWKVLLLKKFTFTNVQETEDKSDWINQNDKVVEMEKRLEVRRG